MNAEGPNIHRVVFAGLALIVLIGLLPAQQGPQTVAEATGYKATSRHADVIAFIREIQRLSAFVRVEILCTSPEGREVPLLVVGKPAPLSPFGLKADKRMVVYIQANIHAGETRGPDIPPQRDQRSRAALPRTPPEHGQRRIPRRDA